MPSLVASYVENFSVFDERCETLPRAMIDQYPWGGAYRPEAYGQLAWNENGIFVRLRAHESAPRAVETGDNSPVYQDSCLEFFVNPCPDQVVFCNFETNANGAMYLAFGPEYEPDRTLLSRAAFDNFTLRTKQTETTWEVAYQVPVTYFKQFAPGFSLYDGLTLPANFYKCGDATEHPHYGCWNPIRPEVKQPNFYHICDFGQVLLQR